MMNSRQTRRIKTIFGAIALLYILPINVNAAIFAEFSDNNGNGSIGRFGCSEIFTPNDCFIDKTYDQIGTMTFIFSTDSAGTFLIGETIFNETGLIWTDFHWSILSDGIATITNVSGIDPFTGVSGVGTTEVDIFGGALASGESFFPQIEITVDGGAEIILSQTPTISSVPIPAAAWLFGSSLLGLVGMARRKKA